MVTALHSMRQSALEAIIAASAPPSTAAPGKMCAAPPTATTTTSSSVTLSTSSAPHAQGTFVPASSPTSASICMTDMHAVATGGSLAVGDVLGARALAHSTSPGPLGTAQDCMPAWIELDTDIFGCGIREQPVAPAAPKDAPAGTYSEAPAVWLYNSLSWSRREVMAVPAEVLPVGVQPAQYTAGKPHDTT